MSRWLSADTFIIADFEKQVPILLQVEEIEVKPVPAPKRSKEKVYQLAWLQEAAFDTAPWAKLPYYAQEQIKSFKGTPKEELADHIFSALSVMSDPTVNQFLKALRGANFLETVYLWINN